MKPAQGFKGPLTIGSHGRDDGRLVASARSRVGSGFSQPQEGEMPFRAVTVSIALSFILLAVLNGLDRGGMLLP